MNNSTKCITYLSDDIFLCVIKNIEKEIHNYSINPANRIYAFLGFITFLILWKFCWYYL